MKKGYLIEEIVDWASALKFRDIPNEVVLKTKYQILNELSASFAGVLSETAPGVIESSKKFFSDKGNSTIFATGEKTSPARALFVNSTLSMTFDYDDYLFLGHTGHSAVFTALAVGEDTGTSGEDLLTAVVIANEIAGRLGASVVIGPHNGQLWAHIHAISSACASSKLLNFNREQFKNAIAIALYEPNFPLMPGFMGADSKVLTASLPAVNGLLSTYLAERGLSGAKEIIDHPDGFLRHFSFVPLNFPFTGLGSFWVTDTLAFKIYPGCAYIDTTMDALFRILDEIENVRGKRVKYDEVEKIIVNAGLLTFVMNSLSERFKRDELNPVNINFSIPLSIAIGILAHRLTPFEFKREELKKNAGKIREIAKKVILKHSPEMTLKTLEPFISAGITEVTLKELGFKRTLGIRKAMHESAIRNLEISSVEIFQLMLPLFKKFALRIPSLISKKSRKISLKDFKWIFPASVSLELKDRSHFAARSDSPLGSNSDPQYMQRVEKKFDDETIRAGIKNPTKLLNFIKNLENQKMVTFEI